MTFESNLKAAGKIYGACARKVQKNSASPATPTARESELLIGFGIASDWVRRSAALKPLKYTKPLMNKSTKSPAVTQMIRFTMAWSSLNALFARPEVLRLLGTTTRGSELTLFKVLLANSGLSTTTIATYEATLQNILAVNVKTTVPGHPVGTVLPTAQVLHEKFTPAPYRSRGVGRNIQAAIASGSMSTLDLATIVYAMRNWTVHGGLMSTSFRSVPRFNHFIRTILGATSEIHLGVSKELLRKV